MKLGAPPGGGGSVGEVEGAETFAESDLTLTLGTDSLIRSGSVRMLSPGDSVTASESMAYDGSSSSGWNGIIVDLDYAASYIEAVLDDNVGTFDEAQLYNVTDGVEVASKTGLSVSGNDTVSFSQSMSAGKEYAISVRNTSTVTVVRTSGAPNAYPAGYSVTDSWQESSRDNEWWNFDEVTVTFDDGPTTVQTNYVEWPDPADVYAWDRAFFEATRDTETVDVYVEEYDGSSWIEIAGPIAPGDKLPADPSRNVRFRVEINRADTANNPRLQSIYRRRVLPGGA